MVRVLQCVARAAGLQRLGDHRINAGIVNCSWRARVQRIQQSIQSMFGEPCLQLADHLQRNSWGTATTLLPCPSAQAAMMRIQVLVRNPVHSPNGRLSCRRWSVASKCFWATLRRQSRNSLALGDSGRPRLQTRPTGHSGSDTRRSEPCGCITQGYASMHRLTSANDLLAGHNWPVVGRHAIIDNQGRDAEGSPAPPS
ncbi:hypothetical protein J2W28_004361 [Variovorax boronicumulans]|nr:hypothetical protein [Variovorax boronicumulans]MDQ0005199.1 hypothetical protein [Variovorax boronicumulans]